MSDLFGSSLFNTVIIDKIVFPYITMKLERGESKDDLESASVQSRTKYLEVGIRPELIKEEVPFG